VVQAGLLERRDEPALERQADALVVRRVLRLRIDADRPVVLLRLALRERDDLLERRDLELAVERRVLRPQRRQPLARTQRLELGEREVLGEPAGDRDAVDDLGRLAACELRWADTSVVPEMSFSWRATRTPSRVDTRSGSMKSAPSSIASVYEAMVCSGR